MRPTSVSDSTTSGKRAASRNRSQRVLPWKNCRFSLIVPRVTGEKWIIRGAAYNYDDLTVEQIMKVVEQIAVDIRTEGRKRVTIWTRTQANADLFQVKRVIWAGDNVGPGFGAQKAGTYSIDTLVDALRFHIGMSG